jgi:hypothetical protein
MRIVGTLKSESDIGSFHSWSDLMDERSSHNDLQSQNPMVL